MKLEKELWLAQEKVPPDTDALENIEVKNAMFNIQVETNKLATLVNKREFDEFIENILSLYTKYLMFHFNPYEYSVSKMINRIHRKIRMYIGNIKN